MIASNSEQRSVGRTVLAAVLALVMFASVFALAPAAQAHNISGCGKKKVTFSFQPDAHLHSKAIFEHTNRIYAYSSISLWWATYCGASSGDNSNFVDIYQKTYIQKLSGGSYSTCYTDSRGWQGSTADPYVNELSEANVRSACNWVSGGNSVRAKALGKFQQSNGTVHSLWGTTGAHSG